MAKRKKKNQQKQSRNNAWQQRKKNKNPNECNKIKKRQDVVVVWLDRRSFGAAAAAADVADAVSYFFSV